jgi:hypothetical protein
MRSCGTARWCDHSITLAVCSWLYAALRGGGGSGGRARVCVCAHACMHDQCRVQADMAQLEAGLAPLITHAMSTIAASGAGSASIADGGQVSDHVTCFKAYAYACVRAR